MTVIHTIPVPAGWSTEQAWEAISRRHRLPGPTAFWVNVMVTDGAFVKVVR